VSTAEASPPARDERGPRRLLPFALFVMALGAMAWFTATPSRAPVRCGTDLAPDDDTLIMLSASWCGYCRRARAFLQAEGIAHCEYDVETTEHGRELFARQPLKVIPVLMLRGDTLVGFNRDEIRQTLAVHGLGEMPD